MSNLLHNFFNLKINDDLFKKINSKFICLLFIMNHLLSVVNIFIYDILNIKFPIATLILYCILLALFILSLKNIVKMLNFYHYSFFFIILFITLLSSLTSGQSFELSLHIFENFIVSGLPFFVVACLAYNNPYIKKDAYVSSIIIFISTFTVILKIIIEKILKINNSGSSYYSQSFGYFMLPACLIFYEKFFEKNKFYDFALFFFQTCFLLVSGARGPLIGIFAFIFIRPLLPIKCDIKKRILFLVIPLFLFLFILLIKNPFIDIMIPLFEKYDIPTRTLIKLYDGTFFNDTTRPEQYLYCIQMIYNHPFGTGIGPDRILLQQQMNEFSKDTAFGWYSHNVVLDLFLHFGIIGGGTILMWLLYELKDVWNIESEELNIKIFYIPFIMSFFPLLFSGFYLNNDFFMFSLGFLFTAIASKKKIKRSLVFHERKFI